MATHCGILAWRIPMDKRAGRDAVHEVGKSDTTERLSTAHASKARAALFRREPISMRGS